MTDSPATADLTPAAERVISDVETLKALSDPVRLRILETMVQASDEDWTVKRLATALGVGPTKLYHHVRSSRNAGSSGLPGRASSRGSSRPATGSPSWRSASTAPSSRRRPRPTRPAPRSRRSCGRSSTRPARTRRERSAAGRWSSSRATATARASSARTSSGSPVPRGRVPGAPQRPPRRVRFGQRGAGRRPVRAARRPLPRGGPAVTDRPGSIPMTDPTGPRRGRRSASARSCASASTASCGSAS